MSDILHYRITWKDTKGNDQTRTYPPTYEGRIQWITDTQKLEAEAAKAVRMGLEFPTWPDPKAVDVVEDKEPEAPKPEADRWQETGGKRKQKRDWRER